MTSPTRTAANRAHDVFLFYEKWILLPSPVMIVALALLILGVGALGLSIPPLTWSYGWQYRLALANGVPPAQAGALLSALFGILALAVLMGLAHILTGLVLPGLPALQFEIARKASARLRGDNAEEVAEEARAPLRYWGRNILGILGVTAMFMIPTVFTEMAMKTGLGALIFDQAFPLYVLVEGWGSAAMIYLTAKMVVLAMGVRQAGGLAGAPR